MWEILRYAQDDIFEISCSNIEIHANAGGMFGFYADPPGAIVMIDRIEIHPLP